MSFETEFGGDGNSFVTGLSTLVALEPVAPLREQVKDALIELIISRKLLPAQHLAETEVAKQLGVSRVPVREALQALQAEGWLDLRPGKGAFVHDATEVEVDEVFAVRIILEEEAARLATNNVTALDIEWLRETCDRGRAALARGEEAEVVRLNAELHRRVATMADNRTLAGLLSSLDRRVRWYFTPIAKTRGVSSWDEHDELIDALALGDASAAAAVMRAHVERSQGAYHVSQEN